jgi:rare lipoprotein A
MRLPVNHALPLAALVLLSGCLFGGGGGEPESRPRPTPVTANGPAADYPVVIGDPFTIGGVTYTPSDKLNYDAVGYASIGPAGGRHISVSHKTLPVPSYAEVTALDSGKTILVRVERRGPMNNDKIVELSPGAAEQLGVSDANSAAIRIRRVNPPEAERAMLRGGNQAPSRMDTPQSLLAVLRRKLEPSVAPVVVASGLPPVNPTPAPSSAPSPQPRPTASLRPDPAPTPKAGPSPRPQPAPAPSPASAPSPAAKTRGHFLVQVGAFSIAENARRAAAKTGGRSVETGRMWRVRMGPFATREQAAAAQSRARAAGFPEARIESAD